MNKEKKIKPGTIMVNDRGWASPIFITKVEGDQVSYYRMDDPHTVMCSMYLRVNGYREMEEGQQLKKNNGRMLGNIPKREQ